MNRKFKIEVCSDLDYEEMVADISYENHTIATITQDKGIDNMEVNIFPPKDGIDIWHFSLKDFIETLLSAKSILLNFKKNNEN